MYIIELRHVRNLKSLSVDKQQCGPVLVSVVMTKLPEEIRLIISRTMPTKEEWNIDQYLETLKERSRISRNLRLYEG